MKFRNYVSLMLILALGFFCGCNKHPNTSATDDLSLAKIAYANYNLAMNAHHYGEARKYILPGSEADTGFDKISPDNSNGSANSSESVSKLTDMLTGELDGDVAFLRWECCDFPVFKVVKQHGKWLFTGLARVDQQGQIIK